MSIFRLAHLSDPHLPPPPGAFGWRDLASKRLLSRLAWRRKRRQHSPAALAAVVADLQAYGPDHVAITGDLTNFASAAEFAAARAWLESLGPARNITISPGNHDALVGAGGPERFAAWSPWLGDGDTLDFPHVRLRDGVAVINLCTAVPTAPWLAAGRLGDDQLSRLRAALAELEGRDLFRVALIHHPPTPGAVSRRKALVDQDALRRVLAEGGVDLVLHGHAHEALFAALPGPYGPIPVLGVPSASAAAGRHAGARWHAIEIERRDGGAARVRVVARGYDPASGQVEALGGYELITPQRP
ncbi:MAG: metallophosphoesterase [Caulobacter sp.]|nr:metallophosphoesterase [Caulobacter sp.]